MGPQQRRIRPEAGPSARPTYGEHDTCDEHEPAEDDGGLKRKRTEAELPLAELVEGWTDGQCGEGNGVLCRARIRPHQYDQQDEATQRGSPGPNRRSGGQRRYGQRPDQRLRPDGERRRTWLIRHDITIASPHRAVPLACALP